jgi:titin
MDGTNTVGNTISGCYLGIDATGTLAVTNGYVPVEISGGAVSNIVGGTTAAARNIISGSGYQGISMHDAGTCFNVVEGNYIGLAPAGAAALSNTWEGIQIWGGAQSNIIGGYTASARNVISGNGLQGVAISDTGTGDNIVAGNYIGLDATGTVAVSNGWSGVDIYGANGNVVGPGNVLSGNGNYGVLISLPNATANVVQGNLIGLNAAGTAAVGNSFGGVGIFSGALSNLVGGATLAAGNVISGNAEQGVVLGNAGTENNWVMGNYIGVNPAGTAAMGNGWAGVNCFGGASGNIIGGNTPGAGNLISGNNAQGVLLQDPGTSGNLVQGNIIGLNAAGDAAIGNAWSGVEMYNQASANRIGGYGEARNFISGNGNYGVMIDYGSSTNVVQGNTIGLDTANGTVIPNTYCAILLYTNAADNLIGGVTLGAANLICGSTADGVQVIDAGTTNNTIRGNSIFNSAYNAIGLYDGGNQSLAAPTLSSAVVTTNTVISGSYNGASGKTYQLDFYSAAPPASSAECMTYLGSISVLGTGGTAAFSAHLGVHLPAGRAVTAAATDPAGNTSPVSAGLAVAMVSTPGDGIPDAWRARYFGGSGTTTNSQSDAFADPDHDGASNYQEFLAGTNPTNAASVLKLTALNPSSSTNVISLDSVNGIVYRILSRDDLIGGDWMILADQVIGSGTNMFFYDPSTPAADRRFYRAQVLW